MMEILEMFANKGSMRRQPRARTGEKTLSQSWPEPPALGHPKRKKFADWSYLLDQFGRRNHRALGDRVT
jgi:hypothetical protein